MDNVPVSNVCERHGIQPSMASRWHRQLLDDGDEALWAVVPQREPPPECKRRSREAKRARKDPLIPE